MPRAPLVTAEAAGRNAEALRAIIELEAVITGKPEPPKAIRRASPFAKRIAVTVDSWRAAEMRVQNPRSLWKEAFPDEID